MRLILNPDDVRHWAASIKRDWTVDRKEERNEDGTNTYIVRHYVWQRGNAGTDDLKTYVIRDRWITGFLKQLCRISSLTDVAIVSNDDETEHDAVFRYITPMHHRKPKRAA